MSSASSRDFHRLRRLPKSPKRVLIIATRQIGDVLCTTPLMRRARELWPAACIDVLGYDNTMGMLAGNPDINQVIESSEHPGPAEYRQLIRRLFRRYDLAIVTQPSDRAHLYGLLAAPKRVGIVPQAKAHNWWKKWLCLHWVELDYWQQHVVVERLRLLPPARQASLTPPVAEPLPSQLQPLVGQGRLVVVHATPMWRFKRWPVSHWAALVSDQLRQGHKVVLTGSASHQDQSLNQEIVDQVQQSGVGPIGQVSAQLFNAAGLLSLGQVASLLKAAWAYVGVDTSITHLAAACGTRTIALFGATPPTNFGPWPQQTAVADQMQSVWQLRGEPDSSDQSIRLQTVGSVTIVQGPGQCVPCRKAGCQDRFDSHSDCLDRLPATAIMGLLRS